MLGHFSNLRNKMRIIDNIRVTYGHEIPNHEAIHYLSKIANIYPMRMECISQCLTIHGRDLKGTKVLNKLRENNIHEIWTSLLHHLFICSDLLLIESKKKIRQEIQTKIITPNKELHTHRHTDTVKLLYRNTSSLPPNLNSVKTLGFRSITSDGELSAAVEASSTSGFLSSSLGADWRRNGEGCQNIIIASVIIWSV